MMFEMLTGNLPFTADSQTALALKHMQAPPPHAVEYNPAVPNQLDLIVNKVLAKEPGGRYRTAGQLGRILSTYRKSGWADTGPIKPVEAATVISASADPSDQPTQLFPYPGETVPSSLATENQTTVPNYGGPPAAVEEGADWLAVGLGLLALVALLGLIPLWYAVYLAYAN
jgi:serine/threonine-protein kinase